MTRPFESKRAPCNKLPRKSTWLAGWAVLCLTLMNGCQGQADRHHPNKTSPTHAQADKSIRLAVASSTAPTTRKLAEAFARQSGRKVSVSSGSSGKFYAQILQGAPYDLFLAADSSYPVKLALAMGSEMTPFAYATGSLALVSRYPDSPWTAALARCQTPVMANPRHAPYGQAAAAILVKQGITKEAIITENAGQVMAVLHNSHADGGLTAWSTVQQSELPSGWYVQQIPDGQYPPLHQWGLALSDDGKTVAAFLTGDTARAILQANGYRLP